MASGLAVIGSNTGGTPEVIGDAGILFTNDSAESLAEALNRVVTDSAYREALGHAARRRALEFSWDRTWREMCGHAGTK